MFIRFIELLKNNNLRKESGSVTLEFVFLIPVLLGLFLFCLEICNYWSTKYLFRTDVYYLTRSLTMATSKLDVSGVYPADYERQREKRGDTTYDRNSGKTFLIHKDKYTDVCSSLSKYVRFFTVDCKYDNGTVYIKARKVYVSKFFISRLLTNLWNTLYPSNIVELTETHTFKIDRFYEDNKREWSGKILGLSSFKNDDFRKWAKKIGELSSPGALERK